MTPPSNSAVTRIGGSSNSGLGSESRKAFASADVNVPETKTVRELLKGVKYSIDYYQREYKWHEKQIRELVDDPAAASPGGAGEPLRV